jgi:hypothetical protein
MTRRYDNRAGNSCGRCGAPLSTHVDAEQYWLGCPYPPPSRRCAYQDCRATDIADPRLWLCADHLPSFTSTRAAK